MTDVLERCIACGSARGAGADRCPVTGRPFHTYPADEDRLAASLSRLPGRICPACGMAAAEGDRYCADCGSAPDRSAWIDGPDPLPAGDGGCSDESPNPARRQRVNRSRPDWRSRL